MKKLTLPLISCCLAALTLTPLHANPINSGHQEIGVQAAEKRLSSTDFDEEIVIDGSLRMSKRVRKGFAAFKAGDYAAAEKQFWRIRNIQTNYNSDIFRVLGGGTNMGSIRVDLRYSDPEQLEVIAIFHYMEGLSQALQGKTDWAKSNFRKAMRFNPKHFDARADYAMLEIETGGYDKAAKHLHKLSDAWLGCRDVPSGTCAAIGQRLLHVETAYARAFAE